MTESVIIEHRHDGVSTICINRPPLNLLNDATLYALKDALDELESRAGTRCVVLVGSGNRAFSGGHEMTEEGFEQSFHDPAIDSQPGGIGRAVTQRIEALTKPVVCGARGWIVGGAISLVLASDVRILSETARFRYVDVKRGFAPSWGLTLARMVHYLGRNHTLDFLLSADDVDARRAYELGLVTRVTSDAELENEVDKIATHLAKGAPLAIQCIKECVLTQYTRDFDEARRRQDHWIARIDASEDTKEGTRAYFERREPVFHGK
jgi:enoyl-CoA hydratase